jgi:phosphoesterase RecJ-like protein
MRNDLRQLARALDKHDQFLLVSHIDPDGDAIGSLIALSALLEGKGKRRVAFDQDGVPEIYAFLAGSEKIKSSVETADGFDAAIFIECPNAERAGKKIAGILERIPLWINIDHHIDNTSFGHLNLVEPELSAIGELVYELFVFMKEPIDQEVAEAIYTAIMTDTGSFRFPNTTRRTHIIASELLALGVKPHEIYQNIYESMSVPAALINAKAHGTLEVRDGISCITITRSMLREAGATAEDTHDIVNFGRSIRDVEVALLFREAEGGVKVSLRSKSFVNVNEIALQFGGGGHLRAAGCTVEGDMEQAKRLIFAAVGQALRQPGA